MREIGPAPQVGLQILPMSAWHIEAVLCLERAAGLTPWSAQDYEQVLTDSSLWKAWVACWEPPEPADRVSGIALVQLMPPEMELCKIAVEPILQRRGIATRLLRHSLNEGRRRECLSCFLEVRLSNFKALQLYQGFGFKVVGRRVGYYEQPREDALLLSCELAQAAGTEKPQGQGSVC